MQQVKASHDGMKQGAGSSPASGDVFIFPASFAQQRLWFLDKLEPGQSAYNVPLAIRLQGNLRTDVLERSLQELVARHEVLRTTLSEGEDGNPVQVVAVHQEVALTTEDLRAVPLHAREADARRRVIEHARTPFDLQRGPLFRAKLLRLEAEDHVLSMSFHHSIVDGWSLGILIRELSAAYEAILHNHPVALPELTIQYGDYAAWHRTWLEGERLESLLAYWKQQLNGAPPVLELPTDSPRPAMQSFVGAQESIALAPTLAQAIVELSQKQGTTLYMTLLAAFNVFLTRYTGQEDIVVGSPVSGRTRSELEGLVGLFVNTLALRNHLSGNPTFREFVRRVRETTLQAQAHQDLPFERLVEELRPERDLSRNPIVQVIFSFDPAHKTEKNAMADINLSSFRAAEGLTAKFDLVLNAAGGAEGLRLGFTYNVDIFHSSTIRRMLSHFRVLLEGIVADPDGPLSELPLLDQADREQMLVKFNATAQTYPGELCVHQLFEQQVERTPGHIAAVDDKAQWSYAELNRRANQLARFLRRQGVGPETRVGICLDRSLDMLAAVLGVLKAGAAYIPLDPAYPRERIALVVEDSGLQVLLTQAALAKNLPAAVARIICMDADWPSITAENGDNVSVSVEPHNVAYMIYTSGSTGKPKGVQIEHRSVVNFLASMQREPGFSKDDVLLAVTTLSFDIAGLELYLPLTVGGKVVIATREQASDGAQLTHLMQQHGISVMQATPATWRLLLDAGWQGDPKLKVLCGGEALPRSLAERLLPRCGELWNMYGPTETTIWSSVYRVVDLNWTMAPIGHPIANTQMYVVDKYGNTALIGVPGELLIGGDGVARGYWNRSELTGEKFVPDTFRPMAGARLYRTGDLVRYLPDGNLQYVSRIDNQVKVRGFRIELGEIESILAKHSSVREVTVVVREDVPGDQRLVAYLVPAETRDIDPSELREHVKTFLPDYMVPSAFVSLAELPLTPNGKVDRRALPAPGNDQQVSSTLAAGFRSPAEEMLAGIWMEVLRTKNVHPEDSFFELGGHSLLATQVVSRIQQALQVDVPLRTIFEHPTIRQLAAAIEIIRNGPELIAAPPLVPQPRTTERNAEGDEVAVFPLSFAEQRLWMLDRLEPNTSVYNLSIGLRLQGGLDTGALELSLQEIQRRHEILRARFRLHEGEPQQCILPVQPLPLSVLDIRGERDPERAAIEIVRRESRRPFDLAQDAVWRATLLQLASDHYVLLITLHHIAFDGWSRGTLIRELSTLYDAYSQGKASPLPELKIQYTDFAVWQREFLSGERLERQINYWKGQLAGAPSHLEIPTDRPRPAMQTFHGAHLPFVVPEAIAERLKEFSRKTGTTLFMTLLGAFSVLLSRYSGQEDVVVGAPIAGRNRSETENLIGFFVNTLPLRTSFSGNPSFRELIERVRDMTLAAYAQQDLPFEKLVEELKPERDLSRNPVFQVIFALQNVPDESASVGGLQVSPFRAGQAVNAKFDLSVMAVEHADTISATFEYNTDLFDGTTIERMQRHWLTQLAALVADPERPVSELPLLSPEERQQLLVEWNDTAHEYDCRCAADLFESQVGQSPNALALASENRQFTYAELNARANQLAHYLQKRGVGPEVPVAICVERGWEMVVGILGICKAGGAYLPLDPSYPAARIAFILKDSAARLLLTQERLLQAMPSDLETIRLDADWQEISREDTVNPTRSTKPDNLAYVIYTSGSTGQPKGVEIQQDSLANLIAWHRRVYEVEESDRATQVAGLAFDASVWEVWPYLTTGASLHIPDEEVRGNPAKLAEWLAAQSITLSFLPTPVAEIVVEQEQPKGIALRALLTGGDKLHQPAREAIPFSYCNHYGPTENTVVTTWAPVARGKSDSAPPIGRPVDNVQLYVLDRYGAPVPIGVTGELHIGGASLARGYRGRPDLTAEKFIANPFSNVPGARLYRTGDLVRYLPDGNLEFIGRADQQVKIRGFRIELQEIEHVLARHSKVRQAAVMVREDVPGTRRLVAYVVPIDSTAQPGAGELRDHLKASVPEYMVPSAFVTLSAMPLTPNGKVDHRALPVPDYSENFGKRVAPRDEVEELLAEIWQKVLGVAPIGITDNFFELGGHSLLAVRLMSEIQKTTGKLLPLATLFQGATIEALANALGAQVAPAEQIITEIQGGTGEPRFFAIVTPGANALGYIALARHLGEDVPLYAIQGPGARLRGRPYSDQEFKKLGADYIRAMKTVQPHGPYYLGGMCEGARIAFDMARLLESEGEEVAFLGIFDTWVVENTQIRWLWRINYYFERIRRLCWLSPREAWETLTTTVRRLVTGTRTKSLWPQTYWPGKNYSPPKFGGNITLFKVPKQPFYYIRDPFMGWASRTTGSVEIQFIRSKHLLLLREPYVRDLAVKLRRHLLRAHTKQDQFAVAGERSEPAAMASVGARTNV